MATVKTINTLLTEEEVAAIEKMRAKKEQALLDKIARAKDRTARQLEDKQKKYFGFCLENEVGDTEYNKLTSYVVHSTYFGDMVVIPSGHDSNALAFARAKDNVVTLGLLTKHKRNAKNCVLVRNNKDTVLEWLVSAFKQYNSYEEAVKFLISATTSSGKQRYKYFDFDELNRSKEEKDTKLANKFADWYKTTKALGTVTIKY